MNIRQIVGNRSFKINDLSQSLRTGQIVQGKIMKLFPNNKAQIQLGSQILIAQLEASLTLGAQYHFQVRTSDSLIHLQVLGQQLKNQERINTITLLERLGGLKATKLNISFVQQLLAEKIPFEKDQLVKALHLLAADLGKSEQSQTILKEMIQYRIPISESTFQALIVRNNETFTGAINNLVQNLSNKNSTNEIKQQLLNRLIQMTDSELSPLQLPKVQFMSQLNQVLNYTGLSYEHHVNIGVQEEQLATIKSMLIQLIQQSDGTIQESSRQLLHFINGMQLQSVNESNSFIQASLLVPAYKLGLENDVALEFEGKKTDSGQIDPDFCRILFYLDLTNLKESAIDMNIQKRTVTITVFNDHVDLLKQSEHLKTLLSEGLKKLNYHLSSLSFKPFQQTNKKNKQINYPKQDLSYKGVDFRI